MRTFISTFILFLAFSITSVAENNPLLYSKKVKDIKSFDAISLNASYVCIFQVDKKEQPDIEIWTNRKNEFDNINITKSNNTLIIGSKEKIHFSSTRRRVVIKIKGQADILKALTLKGSGTIIVRGQISSDKFNINSTGSGEIKIESLKSNNSQLQLTGSGDIEIKTMVSPQIHCLLTGSGDIEIKNIKADEVKSDLRGSGDISLSGKTKSAQYNLKGSGDISALKLISTKTTAELFGSGDIKCYGDSIIYKKRGSGDIRTNDSPKHIQKIK